MTTYPLFMVTNRKKKAGGLGDERDVLRFFEAPEDSKPDIFSSWTELKPEVFKVRLQSLAGKFPFKEDFQNADQRHVSLFVHGYNNSWKDAVGRYAQIKRDIYDANSLGIVVLYTWPSNGSVAGYLPDREDARDSSPEVASLLVMLHEHLIELQRKAVDSQNPNLFCRAKVSVIAHSMGSYVMQKGLAMAAKQLNSPQLVTLVHQLILVAADVDNDIFQKSKPGDDDGSLMANLCYRIAGLYTGLDDTLGASAGLKHFGTRRLGRSGIADRNDVWDNVFDMDVSDLINRGGSVHSAVFDSPQSRKLLERILRGVDRGHLLK